MESTQATINLARRLRPQKFSQIIGQEIPVRMLKNSLYMNKFFPVYLFAGQRGCGKTSTARVFAAAVNCDQFITFQQNPTQADIPCLTCASCLAMQRNAHPDFIEIDAASNTGVDNVRQLIETAAYVPLQGRKKVYLIDEAHMLSKAAFNALLKILEEPPVTVLFMLATTELHKIPQTVLSRCFQLSFPALETQAFTQYLQEVCCKEQIVIEDQALAVLIEETDGSARDALNLLEQVRFIESPVTEESIRKILGKLSITILLDLLEAIIHNNPGQVIALLQNGSFQGTDPQATLDLFVQAVKSMLWLKYAKITLSNEFLQHQERFEALSAACSHNRLLAIMQLLWDQERIFLQTSKKQAFLEFLFIQLAEQDNIASLDELLQGLEGKGNNTPSTPASSHKSFTPTPRPAPIATISQQAAPVIEPARLPPAPRPTATPAAAPSSASSTEWSLFLTTLRSKTADVVMLAILEQATYTSPHEGALTILLRHNTKFFTDKLEEMRPAWQPLLQEIFPGVKTIAFGQQENVQPVTTAKPPQPPQTEESTPPRPRPTQSVTQQATKPQRSFSRNGGSGPTPALEGEFVTPSTPFASLLVTHFPGKLKKLKNFN